MDNQEKPKWIEELEYRQRNTLWSDYERRRQLRAELGEDLRGPEGATEAADIRDGFYIALGLCLITAAIAVGYSVLFRSTSLLWLPPGGILGLLGIRLIKRGVRD